jgi:hypothetical protein
LTLTLLSVDLRSGAFCVQKLISPAYLEHEVEVELKVGAKKESAFQSRCVDSCRLSLHYILVKLLAKDRGKVDIESNKCETEACDEFILD